MKKTKLILALLLLEAFLLSPQKVFALTEVRGGCKVHITSEQAMVRPRRGIHADMTQAYSDALAMYGHQLTLFRNGADYTIDMDVKYSENDGVFGFPGHGQREYSDINLLDHNGTEVDSVTFDSVHWSAKAVQRGYKENMEIAGIRILERAKLESITIFMKDKKCD